ncbi:MAG TPA: dihydrolipoamide acetyltransferase family protein [Candidatus Limnocylindria bacterium]
MALFELKMPKLGESVTEGTIGKWLKQPGEKVEKYDLLVEVQTDKVNTEIPSPVAGTLKEVKVNEGDTVPIGTLLATFDTAEADAAVAGGPASAPAGQPARPDNSPSPSAPPSAAPMPAAQRPSAPAQPASAPGTTPYPTAQRASASTSVAPTASSGVATAPAPSADGEARATPVVRRLAAEHGIDLAQVRGTGLNGRVSRQDVERYIAEQQERQAAPQRPAGAPRPAEMPMPQAMAGDELIPLTQMRKAIANAMVLSKSTIPHAAAMVEVDWTNVARFRDSVRDTFRAREGFELTYLPFAMKAVCLALRRNALVNAKWTDQGVLKLKAINLGVAISLEDEGLVVPVVKNADDLSITGLARAVRDLATRARSRKLTIPDFEGGTFTVNNGGTLGTYLSYPIVNPPQAAIMTTEAIGKRVVALDDDTIGIRTMGNLVLSFDHRVMDGATAARFLRDVKTWIQDVDPGNVALS